MNTEIQSAIEVLRNKRDMFDAAISMLVKLEGMADAKSRPAPAADKPARKPRARSNGNGAAGTKHCPGCGKDKPLDEFGMKRSSNDGHNQQCRECVAKYQREWEKQRKKAAVEVEDLDVDIEDVPEPEPEELEKTECRLCHALCSSKARLAKHMEMVHGKVA